MGVRVEICSEVLECVRAEGSNFTDRIVTCDETWIHFYEPESKQQSSIWKHPTSPSPVKAKLTNKGRTKETARSSTERRHFTPR